jgi:hypothetical protein
MTMAAESGTARTDRAGSGKGTMTMTVGEFVLRRIREAGVQHAFGVPGDFNLEFLQQLEDSGTLTWIGGSGGGTVA